MAANKQVFYSINLETGKAVSTISELRKLAKELQRQLETTPKVDANFQPLTEKLRLAKQELFKFNEQIKGSPSFTQKMAGAFTESFKQIGAGIIGVFAVDRILDFGKACITAFNEAELNATKLKNAVGVNGGLTSDFQKLIKQSEELQKVTIFDDDSIQQVQTLALQFGLTARQVEDLVPIITDFASATGQDLNSALEAVLRGVNGSGKGLKLYGIEVDATKNKAEQLSNITQQLNEKFQGQAAIIAGTASGQLKQLGNSFDDLKEDIGGAASAFGKFLGDVYLFSFDKVKFYQNKAYQGLAKIQEEEGKKNESYLESYHKGIENLTITQLQNIEKKKSDLAKTASAEQKKILNLELQAIRSQITEKNLLQEQNIKPGKDNSVDLFRKQQEEKIKIAQTAADTLSNTGNNPLELNANAIKAQNDLLKFYQENGKALVNSKALTQAELENVIQKSNAKISDLEKSGFKLSLDALKQKNEILIAETKRNSEERFQAEIKAKQDELELLKSGPETNERKLQEIKLQNEILEIRKRGVSYLNNISNSSLEVQKINLQKEYDATVNNEQRKKQLKNQISAIEKAQNLNNINSEIEQLQILSDAQGGLYGSDAARYAELIATKKALDSGLTDAQIAEIKKREENEKLAHDTAIEGAQMVGNAIIDSLRRSSQEEGEIRRQRNQENLDEQLSFLEIAEQKERGTYVEKDAIAKKFDAKKKEARDKAAKEEKAIKLAQAKADKQNAIFSIIINTAAAIMKAAPNIPLQYATGALGLVELGIAAAAPLPAFKDGVHNFKGEGTETSDSNIVRISKGESIIPAKQSKMYSSIIQNMIDDEPLFGKAAVNFSSSIPAFASGYMPITSSPIVSTSTINVDMSAIEKMMIEQRSFFQQELSKERRSYVVENDITTVQNRNRTIENRSLFSPNK